MDDNRLLELKIELNRACPLHCLHCSSNGMPYAPEEISPQRSVELIREFAELGGEKLCISGGEPLCYKGLPVLIKAAEEMNLQTSIYTCGVSRSNGTTKAIPRSTISLLSERGVKTIFSLHGSDSKTHDTLTQVSESFNTTITSMCGVIDSGVNVEVHVVPTAINFEYIEDIAKLVESMGIRNMSWLRLVPQGRGAVNSHVLKLTQEQLSQLARKKDEISHKYPGLTIRTGAPFNILCAQPAVACDAGSSVLTIRPDGIIAPCDAFKRFRVNDRYGNIHEHSLAEIWEKSEFLNMIRSTLESGFAEACSSCSRYEYCKSGCLAQRMIASGKLIDGRDPECLQINSGVPFGKETVTV